MLMINSVLTHATYCTDDKYITTDPHPYRPRDSDLHHPPHPRVPRDHDSIGVLRPPRNGSIRHPHPHPRVWTITIP